MGVWEKEKRRTAARHLLRHGDASWFPRFKRQWRLVLCATGHACVGCGRKDIPVTKDHIVPRHLMGRHDIHNLQPLCWPCNLAKGARTVDLRPYEMIDAVGRWIVIDLLGELLEEGSE